MDDMSMDDSPESMDDLLPAEYELQLSEMRSGFTPGEKVKGKVSAISSSAVFIDVNAKSEGIIDRLELETDGQLQVTEGDIIEAYFSDYDEGEFIFTVKVSASEANDEVLSGAFQSQIPIEGKVIAERKGGFEVKVGAQSGFCPFSQIDLYGARDASAYIGHTFTFRIMEYDGRNLVVSRRQLLEEDREKEKVELRKGLNEGDLVTGSITKVLDFGAFVDIGGVEGLIPASELSWDRSIKPSDIVSAGQKVEVTVVRIDWEKERFTLSLKKAIGDPWDTVAEKFSETKRYSGVVTKLMEFGAFVQLEPGIEGLVHISRLGAGKRLNHASEVLEEGQELEVYIDSIDMERRRISLVLENVQVGREMKVEGGETVTVGQEVTGRVEDIKPFGVFVKLSPTQTGLLHVSEIQFQGMVDKGRDMYKRFPPGSEITVIVEKVEGKRISLSLPKSQDDVAEFRKDLAGGRDQEGLGNMGSILDGLNL